MNESKQIWNYSVEVIVKGYYEEEQQYCCMFCGTKYEKGKIFQINGQLFDADGAIRYHLEKEHGKTVDFLLEQESSLFGISDIQQVVLQLMSNGKDDTEISKTVGIAKSTVRNHRFKLREKEKQAKLYLALMQSLEEKTSSKIDTTDCGNIEEVHKAATMIDDRYNITEQERIKTVNTYMDENDAIKQFPVKEKKKIILLGEIIKNFKQDVEYSEKEINRVLKRIFADYSTLRRALIEYGFMERTSDCKIYRVKA